MAEKFRKLSGKTVLCIGGVITAYNGADAAYQLLKKTTRSYLIGTSGIGYAVAEGALASGAARVILSSADTNHVDAAGRSLRKSFPIELCPSSIEGMTCDLASPLDLESNLTAMFNAVIKSGPIDHIVFTAGDNHRPRQLKDYDVDYIRAAGQVRFIAPLVVAKVVAATNAMTPGPASSITLTNGSVAESPSSGWTAETAYAAGISGMTRAMALDLKPIRVNCVSIGVVDTPLLSKSFGPYRDRIVGAQRVNTYTGECAQPEDVAEMYLALMKDKSTTGSIMFSDGGARYVPYGQLAERPKRSTSLKSRSGSMRGRAPTLNGGHEPVPALPHSPISPKFKHSPNMI